MREKSNRTAPRFSFVHGVIILLCLVLISCHLVGGIYASYISRSSGGDSGRVVKFGTVELYENGNQIENQTTTDFFIQPGVNLQKNAYVSFDESEVATFVFVEIKYGESWKYEDGTLSALNGKISLGVKTEGWQTLTESGAVILYKELSPNEELKETHIFAENGAITVPSDITAADLAAFTDGTISLRAIAVQAGGSFTDAQTAWNAVK